MQTPNLTLENVEKIEKLFPSCIVESEDDEGNKIKKVDFDLLRAELWDKTTVEWLDERYRLDWPWKKRSILKANTPITKTLRPVKEDSVDWDTTQNLYIEWDNFEVLKILQESYLWKIKMIYIDPPYNTGNDFVYNDDFKESSEEYKERTEQNSDWYKMVKNMESNWRFHSDWLSMMYERLKVARDLLAENGAIFISIDDNELDNLTKICDEIFWEKNYIGCLPRITSAQRPSQEAYISITNDYILVYAKSKNFDFAPVIERNSKDIKEDWIWHYIEWDTSPILASSTQWYSAWWDYNVIFNWKTFEPVDSNWNRRRWLWTKDRMDKAIELWIVVETPTTLRVRNYIDMEYEVWTNKMVAKNPKLVLTSVDLMQPIFANNRWTKRLTEYWLNKYFDFSKPVELLDLLLKLCIDDNDIVMDFFSWSATTAEACMWLNAIDWWNRRFIMVQLPEICDDKSEAYKAGYKTICDLWKERIRRAWKKIKEETNADMDYGFRVYRVDESCMKDVYYHPSEAKQENLALFTSNIKEDRTPEDLLTQVILDLWITLDLPIEEKTIWNNKVFYVAWNSLIACFDENIDDNVIDEIAKDEPIKLVFRDACFKDDAQRINVENKVKRVSPETIIKVI